MKKEERLIKSIDYSPLKEQIPYREKIGVVMVPFDDLIMQDSGSGILLSKAQILKDFVENYRRPDPQGQASVLSNFKEWPVQAIVVGIGRVYDEDDVISLEVGDRLYLRPNSGMAMKLEGRIVIMVNNNDIFAVKRVSEKKK